MIMKQNFILLHEKKPNICMNECNIKKKSLKLVLFDMILRQRESIYQSGLEIVHFNLRYSLPKVKSNKIFLESHLSTLFSLSFYYF